jgi:ferrochelatase
MVLGPPLAAPPPRIDGILYKLLQFTKQTETLMTDSASRFGFVAFAETWNGRLAMLGFVIGLGTELLTGQGILSQIGLG